MLKKASDAAKLTPTLSEHLFQLENTIQKPLIGWMSTNLFRFDLGA